MTEISNMPERPLYLHEVNKIKSENEEVGNAEALFYNGNNINAVVCLFVNVQETAYVAGYDIDDSKWVVLTTTDDEESTVGDYQESSDTVIEWMNEKYGEDGYGIYQMYND